MQVKNFIIINFIFSLVKYDYFLRAIESNISKYRAQIYGKVSMIHERL